MSNVVQPTQIRDTVEGLPFLNGPNAQRYLYPLKLAMDVLLEKLNQGMRGHMPGAQTDNSTLPFVGDDRLIVQGPTETPAAYAARLAGAFSAWGTAGSRLSILTQIQAFLQQTNVGASAQFPDVLIVGGNSTTTSWDTIYNRTPIGSPPAHIKISPANWNWDGNYLRWWQWLVIFSHLVSTGQSGTTATFNATPWVTGLGVNSAGVWVPSANATTDGPFVTVTGLSALTTSNVLQYITFTNVANSTNAQTVQIVEVLTDNSCIVAMPKHVIADGNNGSIHWSISAFSGISPGPVWGANGALWGDTNRSIGLNVVSDYVTSIRNILQLWKKADTYYQSIIVAFDGGDSTNGNMFSPQSVQGMGNPDGTWGQPGKLSAGVWVPARVCHNLFDCFADGTGRYVECAVQNVT